MSTSESTFSSTSSFWNTTTALIAATVAMAVVATPDYVSPNKTTDCCGIVDVIGNTEDHPDARGFLLDGSSNKGTSSYSFNNNNSNEKDSDNGDGKYNDM